MCDGFKTYFGGFGQYSVTHERAVVKLPATLSLNDGALVEPLAVGVHAVSLSKMRAGDRVLVVGAGSIALACIFWARKLGADRVVSVSRSPRRAELAMAMGADQYVTAGDHEIARINAALGGPPDVVFEGIGVPGALGKAISYVRRNGTVASLGICTVDDPIVPALAAMKQIRLIFPVLYTQHEFELAARVLDRDALPDPRSVVSEIVGLDLFPAKMEELRGPNTQTKVMLDPWA
jgi:(R,R)-butanediol dehydrogenase/meso-butanediol dehydrogenase/diacetyl reductase